MLTHFGLGNGHGTLLMQTRVTLRGVLPPYCSFVANFSVVATGFFEKSGSREVDNLEGSLLSLIQTRTHASPRDSLKMPSCCHRPPMEPWCIHFLSLLHPRLHDNGTRRQWQGFSRYPRDGRGLSDRYEIEQLFDGKSVARRSSLLQEIRLQRYCS